MSIKYTTLGLTTLVTKRYLGPFWIRRKQLRRTQWYNKEQINKLQLLYLKKLIKHCYYTVPYYKKLMDNHAIKVEHIKSLDDIKLFPILTKEDILNAGKSLISSRYPDFLLRKAYTGGTTGTPTALFRDLFSIGNEHAFLCRQWDWAKLGIREKCAYLSGRVIVNPNKIHGNLYIYEPIMKELILSTYHLSPLTYRNFAEAINNHNIKAIIGYPSAVYLLARSCLESGFKINLKATLTSSEVIDETMKETIKEAFNCNVFDYYGSAERVTMIQTCEHGNYHVIPEFGLTELIPVDKFNKDRCKIISTGFWNKSMPLIRYDLGDIVIKSKNKCECEREFQRIDVIEGRKGDLIKTKSGRHFGSAILTHLLYGTDNIIESQIIQNDIENVLIKYVPGKNFSKIDMNNFKKLIEMHLPSELNIELRKVDFIERTESGKFRPVISHVQQDQ